MFRFFQSGPSCQKAMGCHKVIHGHFFDSPSACALKSRYSVVSSVSRMWRNTFPNRSIARVLNWDKELIPMQEREFASCMNFNRDSWRYYSRHFIAREHSERYKEAFESSLNAPVTFWSEFVNQLHWSKKPTVYFNEKTRKWFEDGEINFCENCIDIHVKNGKGKQTAFIWESPVTKAQSKSITYEELLERVQKTAWILTNKLDVKKGDRVVIYMPMILESVIAMLACHRVGATHSVVFGGFSSPEVSYRIDELQPKAILAATTGFEPGGKIVNYYELLKESLKISSWKDVKTLMWNRQDAHERLGIDLKFDIESEKEFTVLNWIEEEKNAKLFTECVPVKSNHPAYILYTSGSTSRPKGIVRPTGGHMVQLLQSMRHVFGTKTIIMAASDIGWVVGHSYAVYGPLLAGITSVIFEGKPIKTPDDKQYWRMIERHKIETLFSSPTAIRAIKQSDPTGEGLKEFSMGSLKAIFLAGERCDIDTFQWLRKFTNKVVIDNYWQTETGSPILANCFGLEDEPFDTKLLVPGSAGPPVPGFDVKVVDNECNELPPHKEGNVVVKLPLPPGSMIGIWRNEERFRKAYLEKFPGFFDTGDTGFYDEKGNFSVSQRADDIINVAAHRLSTSTMESVLTGIEEVAEAAVVGIKDPIKGMVPVGLIVKNSNCTKSNEELRKISIQRIRKEIGSVASFQHCLIVNHLPKTRSGKILRRTIRTILDGEELESIPATIDDPSTIDHLKEVAKAYGFPLFNNTN